MAVSNRMAIHNEIKGKPSSFVQTLSYMPGKPALTLANDKQLFPRLTTHVREKAENMSVLCTNLDRKGVFNSFYLILAAGKSFVLLKHTCITNRFAPQRLSYNFSKQSYFVTLHSSLQTVVIISRLAGTNLCQFNLPGPIRTSLCFSFFMFFLFRVPGLSSLLYS